MGYRKDKKQKNQPTTNFSERFRTGWQSRYPVLLFVGGFTLLIGIFYAIWLSPWFIEHVQPYILSVNASLSGMLLNLFGQHTQVSGGTIYSPAFSVSIKDGCDAIEAMALFVSTTLAFPMRWKKKIKGLFAGIMILFFLNLIRIITLFLAGIYFPNAFEMLHVEIWPVLIIIIATALWIFLIRTEPRKKAHASS